MNNLEKAARIIERTVLGKQTTAPSTALAITQALAEAGLLMPDLPEPDKNSSTGTPVWWENDTLGVTVYPDGEIGMMVGWGKEARYTAATAREQALALLAAANHAEGREQAVTNSHPSKETHNGTA